MRCKICDSVANGLFYLPSEKCSGGSLDVPGHPVEYFECSSCRFLFADHEVDYGDSYWESLDPVPDGRVLETLRLFAWGGGRQGLSVLDYGCGKGFSVDAFRRLGIEAYGTDVGMPRSGYLYPIEEAPEADVVVACEVVEHFPDPLGSFHNVARLARRGFAFQTAYYDPESCGRDWWYLGPANGHISLYSVKSLRILAEAVGAKRVDLWKGYPGIQAWSFE